MRLGPHDLLEYNAGYRVLICRDCQYAIQKNALGSHLLRHKIYREERQRLLSAINELDIVEPDDLLLPTPDTLPVAALPVMSGHGCTVTGCGYLCASSKRMRRHWSDAHGVNGSDNMSSLERSVKLQTFFRGTKLKYFEVAATSSYPEPRISDDKSGHGRGGLKLNAATSPAHLTPNPTPCPAVDLETLTYFHHFITTASLSLPGAEDSLSPPQYWEKEVIPLALQRQWLMCGLLAISAYYSATLEDRATARTLHCKRATKFYSDFCVGFKPTNDEMNRMTTETYWKVKRAGIHIKSVVTCAQWTFNGFTINQETTPVPATFPQLDSFLQDMRSFVSPESAMSSCTYQSRDEIPQRALDKNGPLENDNARTMLLNHIHTLPYRMAEIFGKPDHEEDAPAILLAIKALSECCTSSFESDALSRAWQCMAGWLTRTTDHFNRMVSLQNSAALVVLAYWAATLVERAEKCGIWFIHGLSRTILSEIRELLSTDDAAWALVQEVIN
ncbi:uncharacterized protein N7458_012332 [Penicillium daleae]|uniref:C2H2-type domain-containing protein n=1 Tax=Penicillium daleae TaxID=63821 RepID=A0AAD6BU65_9EURO|nr:uncharacterized protein N7458_012332 [Penicillium daleae]KAJ5433176.1 hypothetical protein N7458_012332 [Penicillium daleae]